MCIPTWTFSNAVMFAKSRMFWNVRPIPAFTMSFGRELRKTPAAESTRRYQRGRTMAARNMTMRSPIATSARSAVASAFAVAR